MTKFVINEEKNGIEIYFDKMPSVETRDSLKSAGWRWSSFNKCWYNRHTNTNFEFAQILCDAQVETPAPKSETKFEITRSNLISCLNLEDWKSGKISNLQCISRGVKKFLKRCGIDCRCWSQDFAGGDSVHITTTDLNFETEQKINSVLAMFSGGYFDGMNDIYNYYNTDGKTPTTKYFFYENKISEELKNDIKTYLSSRISNWAECIANDWQLEYRQIKNCFERSFGFEDAPVFGK